MFSLLEQHKDGSWWYHPGCTFDTPEEVEECFNDLFKRHPDRPHKCFEHSEPMFQEFATCTTDFKVFHLVGVIHWPKSRKGELYRTDKERLNEARSEFERAINEHIERHGRNARIYISGPMTDRRTGKVSKENIEAFFRAEKRLRDAGNTCIVNPARVWACRWTWLYRIVGYRLTLWYDLQLLKRCDAIYLLNGWKDSVGAYEEFKLAFKRKLYVTTEQSDIKARLNILEFVGTLSKEAWINSKTSGSALNGR